MSPARIDQLPPNMHPKSDEQLRAGIRLPPELGTLVDDALARISIVGPIEAMKWLALAVNAAATGSPHCEQGQDRAARTQDTQT
jgi:hypothetical protein